MQGMDDAVLSFDSAVDACTAIGKRIGRALRGTAFRLLMYPAVSGVWSGELLIYAHSCPGMCSSDRCVNAFRFDAGGLVKVSAKELKMLFKAVRNKGIYAEMGEFTCAEMLEELKQLGADTDSPREADIAAEIREEISRMLKAMGYGRTVSLNTCEIAAFFQNNVAPFICFIYDEELSTLVSRPEFVAASLLRVSRAFPAKEITREMMKQLGDALAGWGKPAFVRMVFTEATEGALGKYERVTIDMILSNKGIGISATAVVGEGNTIRRWVGMEAVNLLLRKSATVTGVCRDLYTTLFVSELEPEDIGLLRGAR